MSATDYQKLILETLQGKTPELETIPPERLDWTGPGAVIKLFDQTAGADRIALIQAIGQLIHNHSGPPPVIAQLIEIASGLDLAEVEPDVRALKSKAIGSKAPLKRSIVNYLAYRKLVSNGHAAPTPPGRRTSRAQSKRKPSKRK